MHDSHLTNDSSIFATRLSVLQTALDIPRAELDDNTSKIMLREQDLPPPLLLTVLIALKLCLPPPGHPRRPPLTPAQHLAKTMESSEDLWAGLAEAADGDDDDAWASTQVSRGPAGAATVAARSPPLAHSIAGR